jgi:hypothetical protein
MSIHFVVKSSAPTLVTPVVVQTVKHSVSASSSTAQSVAYAANVTAGNTLIGTVGYYGTTYAVSSVKDALNNTNWTLAGTFRQGFSVSAGIYYYQNTAGGACTATATLTGSETYLDFAVIEVNGLSGVIDVTSGNTGATTGTVTPGALVTTQANDFLLAYCNANGSTTGTAGWTFTALSTSNNGFQYIIEPSAGTYTPNFTILTNTWAAVAVAFKAS